MPPGPKNNLQEVLRTNVESGYLYNTSSTPSTSSKKFKPAPLASARPANPSTLPSFSTPGFRRGVIPPRSDATLDSFGIIDVSSDSSPGRSVKRTSSDPYVASDPSPQLSKRPKKGAVGEKENQVKPTSTSKHKGKVKDTPLQPHRVRIAAKDDEDEPWLRTELDTERNPFVKLDRDFPAFSARYPPTTTIQQPSASRQQSSSPRQHPTASLSERSQPFLPERDQDLPSMSKDALRQLLSSNSNFSKEISDRELKHFTGETNGLDVALIQRVILLVNERNESIKKLLAFLDTHGNTHVTALSPPIQLDKPTPVVSSFVRLESISAAPEANASSSRKTASYQHDQFHDNLDIKTPATGVMDSYNNDEYDEPMPESETDYWAGVEDVPYDIDDSYIEEPLPFTSETMPPAPPSIILSSALTASPYYAEIMVQLKSVFGLKSFRHNQLEAITEALRGRDVFVLMPTGGGKSLCYQLPAVCQGGKTKGVTVVISPLLALMKDQVHALRQKNIDVFLWNSEASYEDAITHLRGHRKPSLVYITPEKLKDNNTATRMLGELYRNKNLARFVIDEAHCISTWGQDFREAYQNLDALRDQFPHVPIMALTATARKVTVADITQRLKLRDHAFLTQSFNRPNLKYVIKPKAKKWMEEMMGLIKTKHPKKSGVIYCLGREKCEEVARKLSDNGFSAKHFHAGMTTTDKDQTLDEWRTDKVHIIVATIAFGMGIDKADVRFVIHYSLPKSLDGYYQETGRAGRDGKPADCILYFLHKDFFAIKKMIERPDFNKNPPSKETIDRQTAQVRAVVDYCMSTECRRVDLLHYFDEKFDPSMCKRGCDNCDNPAPLSSRDVTKEAKDAVELVKTFQNRSELVTLAQSRDILRGANTSVNRNKGYDEEKMFGSTRDLTMELVDILLRKLCMMDVLAEHSIQQASGFHTDYVKLGPGAPAFLRGNEEIVIRWRPKSGKVPAKMPKQPAVKPASKRGPKGKQKAVDLDPIELYEEDSPFAMSDDDDEVTMMDAVVTNKMSWPPSYTRPQRSELNEDIKVSEVVPRTNGNRRTPGNLDHSDTQPDPGDLYKQMYDLRDKIMVKDKIPDSNDIFSDQTLQLLSATCPQDYNAFLTHIADDFSSEQEATERFKLFGQPFLDLCIRDRILPKAPEPELNIGSLRSRYEFQNPGSASAAPATTRTFKFKPHR